MGTNATNFKVKEGERTIMVKKDTCKVGDVFRLKENHKWGGCLVRVTEPKKRGFEGVVYISNNFDAIRFEGEAFVRVAFEDAEYVGRLGQSELDVNMKNKSDEEDNTEEVASLTKKIIHLCAEHFPEDRNLNYHKVMEVIHFSLCEAAIAHAQASDMDKKTFLFSIGKIWDLLR